MDRITRKSLKSDRFAAEVTQSVEYIAEHRQRVLLYGGIGVAVAALVIGIFFYRQHRRNAAHDALYKAFETYRALVTDEERGGRVTFPTEEAKNTKALEQFQAIAKNYSGSMEGKIARYYVGLVYHDMGKMAEAQKQLEEMIGEGQDNVTALARLTLADVYLSQGKEEEARKLYEYLVQHPTDTVPESRAQIAMARYLRPRKPDEARKLLEELRKRPGSASAVAASMLGDMGRQ